MTAFRNRKPCPAGDRDALRVYLLRSCVPWVVTDHIDRGAAVQKAEVSPLSKVGMLRTFFGNIGDVHSGPEFGERKFLVHQAREVLWRDKCPDREMRATISKYVR